MMAALAVILLLYNIYILYIYTQSKQKFKLRFKKFIG